VGGVGIELARGAGAAFDALKLVARIEAENPTETIRLMTSDGFSAVRQHKNHEQGNHAKKLTEALREQGAFQEVPSSLREEIEFLKALMEQGHLEGAGTAPFLLEALYLGIEKRGANADRYRHMDWISGSSLPRSPGDARASSRALVDRFRSIDASDPWRDVDPRKP
jgi:hypothetical protein